MIMEKEEEEEELFTEWPAKEGEQESTEEEDEGKEMETERKRGLDIHRPSVSLTSRRASLPCPAKLSTMNLTHLTHLTHLHMATMAPSPVNMRHRLKGGGARKTPYSQQYRIQDEEKEPKCEKQPSAIPNLLHVPENRGRFRSRNVLSLVEYDFVEQFQPLVKEEQVQSDADSVCLICHDDLFRRGGGTIRELHCSHSFHSQCIEEWLWMKQTCPLCHKHMAMPEPLYWTSARLKVP